MQVSSKTRDLNYNSFFSEGETQISRTEEYNSHNTYRMNIEETKKLLLKLDFIRDDVRKVIDGTESKKEIIIQNNK